jgi:hypothetical protein
MKAPGMKPSSAAFLQVAIVLVGIGTLGLMLWEPHLEGRNTHATTFEIYFQDPFLAYVYVGSIPFFVGLQRAFRLFGDVGRRGTFSPESVKTLRTISLCALTIIGFVAGGVLFFLASSDGEDRPAGIFMSVMVALPASAVATAAALSARALERALRWTDVHPA